MASGPPPTHPDEPATPEPASPVPAPSGKPPVESDIDDPDPQADDAAPGKPVW